LNNKSLFIIHVLLVLVSSVHDSIKEYNTEDNFAKNSWKRECLWARNGNTM